MRSHPKGRKRAAKPSKTRSKSSGKTEIVRERVHFHGPEEL